MTKDDKDIWWQALHAGMWTILITTGFFSSEMFTGLRRAAAVVPTHAVVNSEYFITFVFAAMVGLFSRATVHASSGSAPLANNKGLSLGLLALAAFFPFPFYVFIRRNPNAPYSLLSFFYCVKLFCFMYIFRVYVRHFARDDKGAFAKAVSFFQVPNSSNRQNKQEDTVGDGEKKEEG